MELKVVNTSKTTIVRVLEGHHHRSRHREVLEETRVSKPRLGRKRQAKEAKSDSTICLAKHSGGGATFRGGVKEGFTSDSVEGNYLK